jgi:Ca2+-binding RTX toxin-like protein
MRAFTLAHAEMFVATPSSTSTSRTSLDQIPDLILTDRGLRFEIPGADILEGARAANGLNLMIVEGVRALGLGNDRKIDSADVFALNAWFKADAARYDAFLVLHGDDDANSGLETAYHLVQGDSSWTAMFGRNMVDTVGDGIYHIGFDIIPTADGDRFVNEDGDQNQKVSDIADWLDYFLADVSTTGTGLDDLVEVVLTDRGLSAWTNAGQIMEGARAANTMNKQLLAGLTAVGALDDNRITAAEIMAVNLWVRGDAARLAQFIALHGDDEGGTETGYHTVQGDGGRSTFLGENFINTIGDGIYHYGFEIVDSRFQNEDGDANADIGDVATWLNYLMFGAALIEGSEAGTNKRGRDTAETFRMMGGDDGVEGKGGADTIDLGTGDDWADGGDGDDNMEGGAGNDELYGGWGNDTLSGGADNDWIFGFEGDDTLLGGAGNDRLGGEEGDDSIDGGEGNDEAWGALGRDRMRGGNGNDMLNGQVDDDLLWGDNGDDTVRGGSGRDRMNGGNNNDSLEGGDGNDTLYGDAGNDTLRGGSQNDSLFGAMGNDQLFGSAGDDTLQGEDGNDQLNGDSGNDSLLGGAGADGLGGGIGNDMLDGGLDDDRLVGHEGADTLLGGIGNDTLRADAGEDWLEGGAGADSLDGGDGADVALGGEGDDTLLGQTGADRLSGGTGQDRAWGGDDADRVLGGRGDDTLDGGAGNDSLSGGFGADSLRGGTGDDLLISRSDAGEPDPVGGGARVLPPLADAANDVLRGDAGADIFRFDVLLNSTAATAAAHLLPDGRVDWAALAAAQSQATHARWLDGIGADAIGDFQASAGDVIQIRGLGVTVAQITYRDTNGDNTPESIIRLTAGAGGDALGTITVFGERVTSAMLQVDATAALGAWDRPAQAPYLFEEGFSVLGV